MTRVAVVGVVRVVRVVWVVLVSASPSRLLDQLHNVVVTFSRKDVVSVCANWVSICVVNHFIPMFASPACGVQPASGASPSHIIATRTAHKHSSQKPASSV
jgi:hypothetical protein